MNKVKLGFLALSLTWGVATAAPCDGFQIKLKNNLADDLLVTHISLNGAEIQPKNIEKLTGGTEQVFTVNKSVENVLLTGQFTLRTISLPVKKMRIGYTLLNSGNTCQHNNFPQKNDYAVDNIPGENSTQYVVSNR